MSTSCDSAFKTALHYIPGGVNSPVRAFGYVGGTPLFIAKAKGAYIEDIHGQSYVDYIGSWGPMILGHNHPAVIKAVHETVDKGLSFGAPTELETQLAQQICALIPSIEQIRMVNSGTEATMSAIRLARGYTKRNKIIKFIGCYHGHSDGLLVQAGSGALTFGHPSSPGVPPAVVEYTLLAPYNDLSAVEALFSHYGEDIAAIIIEPVAGNMNCVLPNPGFLQGLRQLCDRYQAVLIFDEVMTGFRVHPQGAQGLYGIKPDLSTFGKIIGGGMPVGAFGGRLDIMQCLAPIGPVYQAGTLSGNPVTMAAGLATLNELSTHPEYYVALQQHTTQLLQGLQGIADEAGIPFVTTGVCGMFGFYFRDTIPTNLNEVKTADEAQFKRFFHGMLAQGIYLAPSAFEAGFISLAHNGDTLDKTLTAAKTAIVL